MSDELEQELKRLIREHDKKVRDKKIVKELEND